MVKYEDVSSIQKLNQKVTEYVAVGYKVEKRTASYAKLVKKGDDIGTDTALWSFAAQSSTKRIVSAITSDEIIFRVKNDTTIDDSHDRIEYCSKCGGVISSEEVLFCPKCGNSLNQNSDNNVNCPFCLKKIPLGVVYCGYCGECLDQETAVKEVKHMKREKIKRLPKKLMNVRGFFEKK